MPPDQPRNGPPHNPGLRDLVSAKRRWTPAPTPEDAARGYRGWNERGYLPHRETAGLIQFVTFRLADSFPSEMRSEWDGLVSIEDAQQRRTALQGYLDKSRGECVLGRREIGELVDSALRFNHRRWYELRAWVVMPNHVHVLFLPQGKSMGRIVGEWKEYTAREANRIEGRSGRRLWARDYWDVFIRDAGHEKKVRGYIESNPVKAFLVRAAQLWPWSSARFRDQAGGLAI